MTPPRFLPTDALVALLLALAAATLYAATGLGRIYGNDGAMLAKWTALPELAYGAYHNTLYLPAAGLLRHLLPDRLLADTIGPLWLARSLSILPAALGLAFTFACCRLLGATRAASTFATTLLAVSPAMWFFGAAIEVHALHFLIVAFCAWVTLVAPWQRPGLALAITAAAFVLPYLSHQSAPTLGPGWILLVQCARRRRGPPFAWRTLLGIGVVLLLALGFGHMLVQWQRGRGFSLDLGDTLHTVGVWRRTFHPAVLNDALLAPFAVLVPLLVMAALRRDIDGWLRGAAGLTLLPLLACVAWWGIPEHGGYLLGPAFLMAALLAALWTTLPRRAATIGAAAAIAAQALAGWHDVREFDGEGFQLTDRVARVQQAIGERGFVLSCNDNAPPITIWLPAVQELNLGDLLAGGLDQPVATLLAGSRTVLQLLAANPTFVLDRSYTQRGDAPQRLHEFMAGFEALLREQWQVEVRDDPSWPLWVLTRR
ncbi:MAG: hypothetical protein IT455_05320 [Planctomycetes bacterium]|nr:hypothetical protein [Planctomycetota bacterium]